VTKFNAIQSAPLGSGMISNSTPAECATGYRNHWVQGSAAGGQKEAALNLPGLLILETRVLNHFTVFTAGPHLKGSWQWGLLS
jgi:hypothetical protein